MGLEISIKKLMRKSKTLYMTEFAKAGHLGKLTGITGLAVIITLIAIYYCWFSHKNFPQIYGYIFYSLLLPLNLILIETRIFYSRSFWKRKPKKPSLGRVLSLFLLFFAEAEPFGVALTLEPGSRKLLLAYIPAILVCFLALAVFLLMPSQDVKYSTAGTIFTYLSPSTAYCLIYFGQISILLSPFLKEITLHRIESILNFAQLEVVLTGILTVIIFLSLAMIFFWIKESILKFYGNLLILSKSKKLKDRRRIFEKQLHKKFDEVVEDKAEDIDRLRKEIELVEREIVYLDQEIGKIEKEFEFRRPLKLKVIAQVFWTPVSIEVAFKLLELFRIP